MNENPLVTVNILSFNRKDELRNTLTKVYEQDYKNIEVIVVDNASNDNTSEMVKNEFPSVRFINSSENRGIAGYNKGFKLALGKYILVLDDDSYPDKNTISKGIKLLEDDDVIGIVAFNISNLRFGFYETLSYEINPISFVGCGALIRKSLLNLIGLYNELFFIYYNELDLSARCYNSGFKVFYSKDSLVFHNQSPVSRKDNLANPFQSKFRYYHSFRGISIFLIQFFYLRFALLYLIKWIFNRFIICVKFNFYKDFFLAIKDIANILPRINRKNVLKYEVQKFYKFGNFFPLIDRDYFPNFNKPKWLIK